MAEGKDAKPHASKHLSVRLPMSEYEAVEYLMDELGMTRTEVLVTAVRSLSAPDLDRAAWLRIGVMIDELVREVTKLNMQMSAIGVNVNQLTRLTHIHGMEDDLIQKAYAEMKRGEEAFREALARRMTKFQATLELDEHEMGRHGHP